MARVAVVTGGTRGIGRAITEELHAKGYKVAATFAGNEAAARACAEQFPGVKCYKFDVGNYAASEAGIKQIEADLGAVDVLVNNAGITRDAMFHKMKPEHWSEVMRTNLDSMFNMTRPVIEGMRARGFGRIINISSINGQKGQLGQSNYAAAKAAVIGFTKSLAQEGAVKGVTANVVAPGYIDTEMLGDVPPEMMARIVGQIPVGRLGKADEVARCVSFLAGEEAGFITGATISINGGQYITT